MQKNDVMYFSDAWYGAPGSLVGKSRRFFVLKAGGIPSMQNDASPRD
jgi:hypothetical protein